MPCVQIAKIAVENTAFSFDMLFDYLIPESLKEKIQPGCRVLVSFGNSAKKRQGFVFEIEHRELTNEDCKKLKKISDSLDEQSILNNDIIALSKYLAEHTFCTYFEAAKASLPSGMCLNIVQTFLFNPDFNEFDILTEEELNIVNFVKSKKVFVRNDIIAKNFGLTGDNKIIDRLYKKGCFISNTDSIRKTGDASVKIVELNENFQDELTNIKFTQKQKSVINTLTDTGPVSVKELCYFTGVTSAVVENLVKKQVLKASESEIFRKPNQFKEEIADETEIVLNSAQKNAFNSLHKSLCAQKFNTSLLFGVTGSGKTKVYMKLIDSLIKTDKSVIVMVPEISLTPQLLETFYSRYGDKVAVLHSGLSYGERLDEWKRIKQGIATIVIGTRSAVFAPCKNLAMIVIDEEQEATYKSEMTPRYHTRDVAKFRCAYSECLLVLASATPSIESYAYALNGRYNLEEIPYRYSKSGLPEVKVIDISDKSELEKGKTLSKTLLSEIKYNLDKNEQSILLINRRGFNTFVSCSSCKSVISCPNCSISLTYHSANNRLMCHYCGYSQNSVSHCPDCGNDTVKYSGFGTQKVEQELLLNFPDAKILRMDADTVNEKNAHEKKFSEFANGDYDIMIGTQMVAKGLNFPNVTLVGVISVDQQLYDDDFRSIEKTFDLLTQVIGRSGRGENKGRAVIQTLAPENTIISYASQQDYKSFFNGEIKIRKGLIYPPYCDICIIGFSSVSKNLVKASATNFFNDLKKLIFSKYQNEKLVILGPVEPRTSKVNGKFRQRIIIKCKNSNRFRKLISEELRCFMKNSKYKQVSVYADINPESTF